MEADTPKRGWRRPSASQAPPILAAAPAHADPRPHTAGYSATALRQLNPSTPTLTSNRSDPDTHSMPASGPVLVTAYSRDAQVNSRPAMSRRFFPFSGLRVSSSSSSAPRQPNIPLPSDKDFSIESILQAIEPDIRDTLDSIADICGRSKLSLSNQYGSHIAPLGEIIAPPDGLGAVEEATPDVEQPHITIVDGDDMDAGLDMHPFSFYRYLENLRTASVLENGWPQQGQAHSHSPRSPGMDSEAETVFAIRPEPVSVPSTPFVREFASRPNHTGCDLLAKNAAGTGRRSSVLMATPAVVSEVHLDASADEGSSELDLLPGAALSSERAASGSGSEIVQSLLDWLNWTPRVAGPASTPVLQSAEGRLRAMLRVESVESEGTTSTVT
ncbi:uncharacterized protein N7529_010786 [Penicillium soppii]|uniref:uncharacterized protein n=1 Tax=Penicillium soppii TaxID=69789 RepID=UPI00254954A2|nr:uncharacterized protein N7529_010786 [Penicillium soppii]KAJ5851401.1 hypothetical protein N7529_010786 [Penicillium soppii]